MSADETNLERFARLLSDYDATGLPWEAMSKSVCGECEAIVAVTHNSRGTHSTLVAPPCPFNGQCTVLTLLRELEAE